MKKCSFFSVLLTALLMFVGFESNAQSFKTIAQAKVIVKSTIEITSQTMTPKDKVIKLKKGSPAASQYAYEIALINVGRKLLDQFKANVDVEQALNTVDANGDVATSASPGARKAKDDAVDYYRLTLKN